MAAGAACGKVWRRVSLQQNRDQPDSPRYSPRMPSQRRANDFYPTPEWATAILLQHVPAISGWILEPCVGDGAISKTLCKALPKSEIRKNDIDITWHADTHLDAADPAFWATRTGFDWVVTNPPFNRAAEIVPLAWDTARRGIAMLLRLSFLEPCSDRIGFLEECPPTQLIVLPRISFTGDGKTDSVTCAWMVWDHQETRQRITIVPKEQA